MSQPYHTFPAAEAGETTVASAGVWVMYPGEVGLRVYQQHSYRCLERKQDVNVLGFQAQTSTTK
jgi:hypothetical protein